MTAGDWMLLAVTIGACALLGLLVTWVVDWLFLRLGWTTRHHCRCCGDRIPRAWAATDAFRASHYCPMCLYGPLPGRSS